MMLPALLSDEDCERGSRPVALIRFEELPRLVPGVGQLGAGAKALAVLGCHLGGEIEWFLDEGE